METFRDPKRLLEQAGLCERKSGGQGILRLCSASGGSGAQGMLSIGLTAVV